MQKYDLSRAQMEILWKTEIPGLVSRSDIVLEESDNPFARLFIQPVGGEKAVPSFFYRLDALDLEGTAFVAYPVECLRLHGKGLVVESQVLF